jgi:MFS family permease
VKTVSSKGPWPIIGALMIPVGMMILNTSMFSVALPSVRRVFALRPDSIAWLVAAYSLPTTAMMPLYARLGDVLPQRAIFAGGLGVFLLGTVACFLGATPPLVVLGRLLQGFGASGINPLGLAIISGTVGEAKRGRALGIWHSAGPIGGLLGPVLAGLLIEAGNWRTIFLPSAALALVSVAALRIAVPARPPEADSGDFRNTDWLGASLAAATMTLMTVYIASEPITGARPFTDWRVALALGVVLVALVLVEKRRNDPVVDLALFRTGAFLRASLVYTVRMTLFSAVGLLAPFHLSDLLEQPPGTIGLFMALQSAGLAGTLVLGGLTADRFGPRAVVRAGIALQTGAMLLMAAIPMAKVGMGAALILQGAGGGLSLAALDIAALGQVERPRLSSAAGLYFMFGAAGTLLGAALAGVALQSGLDRGLPTLSAYRASYVLFALLGVAGFTAAPGATTGSDSGIEEKAGEPPR